MNTDNKNFSDNYQQMYDVNIRITKAKKAIAILNDFFNDNLPRTLLDIGCSTGIMTNEYSKYFKNIIGIDIDSNAIKFANENYQSQNLKFLNCSYDEMRLSNKKFNVITLTHIYEHVDDPVDLFEKIYELLSPGGVCYFVAGNRFKIIEPHFNLPFLSYLPKNIAKIYLKMLFKNGDFYQKHLSLINLRKLVKNFVIHDYTLKTIQHPGKYISEDLVKEKSLLQKLYLFISKNFYFFVPTYIWVLEKKITEDHK